MFTIGPTGSAAGEFRPRLPVLRDRAQSGDHDVGLGKPSGHPHDEISTDKRHPTVNANGPVYGADFNDDDPFVVDSCKNTTGAVRVPTIADRSTMRPTWPKEYFRPIAILRKRDPMEWSGRTAQSNDG